MNEAKLKTAIGINAQIESLNRLAEHWEGRPGKPTRGAPHEWDWMHSHCHGDVQMPAMPKADRAWREYCARVLEELTLQRDQLKREFEVM